MVLLPAAFAQAPVRSCRILKLPVWSRQMTCGDAYRECRCANRLMAMMTPSTKPIMAGIASMFFLVEML